MNIKHFVLIVDKDSVNMSRGDRERLDKVLLDGIHIQVHEDLFPRISHPKVQISGDKVILQGMCYPYHEGVCAVSYPISDYQEVFSLTIAVDEKNVKTVTDAMAKIHWNISTPDSEED